MKNTHEKLIALTNQLLALFQKKENPYSQHLGLAKFLKASFINSVVVIIC